MHPLCCRLYLGETEDYSSNRTKYDTLDGDTFPASPVFIITAPFCVLGGMTTFRWLSRLIPAKFSRAPTNPVYLRLLVILVLIPYFLFYSSIIYTFTGDPVTSTALNSKMDYPRYNEQEVNGKEWLLSNMATDYGIVSDWYGLTWLVEPYLRWKGVFWGDTEKVADDGYIF